MSPRRLRPCFAFVLVTACVVPGRRPTAPEPSRAAKAAAPRPSPEVEALLGQMSLDEKIGQMTQADLKALKPETDVATFGLGSLLSGGDSLPQPNDPAGWADTYDRLQGQALSTRLGIPLIYGIDAVHGNNGLRGAVIFPHNIGLGCTRNPALVAEVARITALEVAGTGIDWTFAPCLAVPRDERWGRTYEGFGEWPELAASLGAAAVTGYQGATLGDGAHVLACAKHFVGDGGTTLGKDQGDTQVSEAELRALHLPGYLAAIKAGVGSVMVSYSSWNGVPMHANRALITDVLKGELGFKGFVVTDWQAIDKLPGEYPSDVETAINAGIDMVMVPNQYRVFIATLKALVEAGRVPRARIDNAVRRILAQKVALRLWERPFTDRSLTAQIGSDAHRAVARQAVRESLVLLKNERHALPLPAAGTIAVMGARADDLGAQCGGWCLSWQGRRGAITRGTTILEGLRGALGAARVTFSDTEVAPGASAVVVVVGENPYAEGKGDRQNLALAKEDAALVERARSAAGDKPVIVVLIAGRPLILGSTLQVADAIVAAWLPGTEGAGVADILVGAAKPTGKLSHSWPRAMNQVPINKGDAVYDPLFPYDFGLTY